MKKHSIRKRKIFQSDATELVVLEKVGVVSSKGQRCGYCHVTLEPYAVIVHHAGVTHAVNMQGSVVSVDQLPVTG